MLQKFTELMEEAQKIQSEKTELEKLTEELKMREDTLFQKLREIVHPEKQQLEMFNGSVETTPEWQRNLQVNDKFFTDIPVDIADLKDKLREARRAAGHAQKEAAVTVGLVGSTWSRLERGVDQNYRIGTLKMAGEYIKKNHPHYIPF